MPSSHPELVRPALLAALLFAGAARAAAPEIIDFSADTLAYDNNTNRALYQSVEIRQGAMSIRADEGSIEGAEANFSNSEWRFSGAVHITFGDGELDASEAIVKFGAGQLQSAHITGTPATFSHQGKEGEAASRGRATTIDYNAQQARVVFSGNVWFSKGSSEMTTSAPLTYNITSRAVLSSQGVQIRIFPKDVPAAAKPPAPSQEAP